MRCPRCHYEGDLIEGGCARCGYGRRRVFSDALPSNDQPGNSQSRTNQSGVNQRPGTSYTLPGARQRSTASRQFMPVPNQYSPVTKQLSPMTNQSPPVTNQVGTMTQPLLRSDILRQGRYILQKQVTLPANQQKQGRAWLARDTQRANTVVVVREVILPEGSTVAPAQVMREAALRQSHLGQRAGFPKVVDMFSERGTAYIVLEHMEGKSLGQVVREHGALPERAVVEYGRQLCGMIEELASQEPPLIHGSINPDTVMVTLDGKRAFLSHIPLFPPERVSPGSVKATTGSTGYLAPEQVRGNAEPASDQYALAATLHHALTEYDPDKHMSFFFPPVRRLNPVVSQRMESIISQALRLSLAQRYSRALKMQREFETVLTSSPAVDTRNLAVETDISRRLDVMRSRERRSNSLTVILFAIVSALVIFLLLGGILLSISRAPSAAAIAVNATATANAVRTEAALQAAQVQAALKAEQALEKMTFTRQGIGISDGHYIFDTFSPRPLFFGSPCQTNVACKDQAAAALNSGDLNTATILFSQAFTIDTGSGIGDPTDAEARIYNQDATIAQAQLPYVSIVLGLGIDGSNPETLAVAQSELEGAFVAQYEINEFSLLPHRLLLRVLIANSGSKVENVTTLAQFITTRVTKAGNPDHIIAVVGGWPSSAQMLKARTIITAAQIPFISQIASDVKLSAGNAYTFHINPLYDAQASNLATIVGQLGAKRVFVLQDANNPDSATLASQFVTQAQAHKLTVLQNAVDNFSEGSTTVDGYKPIVQNIVSQQADLIFLAGSDVDAVRLAHAVGLASLADPTNSALAKLKILGGTALDSNLLLGQGSGPDAMIAHSNPKDMQRLNFIAFADPNELATLTTPTTPTTQTTLNPALNEHPPFFTQWAGLYQNSLSIPAQNALPPDQFAIMTYDALNIVAHGAGNGTNTLTGQAVRDGLRLFGSENHSSFPGISGHIVFDSEGNPTNKAVGLLEVVAGTNGNVIRVVRVLGNY